MTLFKKNALSSVMLLLGLFPGVILAAGDIESKLTSKVNSIVSIATNVGYGLCTVGLIVGGILWGTGNPRGKGVVIGALIGAAIIALASGLIEFMK